MPGKISDKPPSTVTKPAPFAVAQPEIPGVPRTKTAAAAQRQKLYALATGGASLVILLVVAIWWARASTRAARSDPIADVPVSAAPVVQHVVLTPALPVAPGQVATTDQLSRPWATQRFTYRNTPSDSFPAMVVRLPGNAYWAFSLLSPYGTCDLEFVADTEELRSKYHFPAAHPMVVDPCSHTLYDLAKYGSGPNGLVRGAIVAGTGIRPPLAIEIQINGSQVITSRAEKQ
ncbi:MAG TPA: hypothetical protein VGR84_00115 [Candidatus Acidoferrales bacterium]|nr:hypothetical protein [Candidatus Acidoferrales bacterium]